MKVFNLLSDFSSMENVSVTQMKQRTATRWSVSIYPRDPSLELSEEERGISNTKETEMKSDTVD